MSHKIRIFPLFSNNKESKCIYWCNKMATIIAVNFDGYFSFFIYRKTMILYSRMYILHYYALEE